MNCNGEGDSRNEDAYEAEESPKDCGGPSEGERAKVDGKVEIGAWEGLDYGKAEEEVTRGYPAYIVSSQQIAS